MSKDNRAKNIDFIRNSNLKLLASLKIIKTDIVLLKELSDFEKNEIDAVENANRSGNNSILSSVRHFSPEVDLSKNSDEEKLFQSISTYEKTVIPNLDELIKIFDDESRALNSYFNKTDSDTFQYSSQLVSIIVQNGEKIKAIVDYLVGFIPAFSKLELELVGYADKIDDVLIDEYYRFYNKLYSSILDKTSNTFSLMINLEIILSFLNGIMGTKKDLIGDFETEFLTFLEKSKDKNKEDGIIFANNSLKHETMSNILPSLSTFIKDFGNENGGFNELNNNIKDDDMKKVKAYLNSVLKNLFKGTTKDLDKQIDKIVPKKKSEASELKKEYNKFRDLVNTKIHGDNEFIDMYNNPISSINFLKIHFKGLEEGKYITFEKFEKDYLNDSNEDSVKDVIRILTDIFDGAENKDGSYENFLNLQKKLNIVRGDVIGNSRGGKVTEADRANLKNQMETCLNLFMSDDIELITNTWRNFHLYLFGEHDNNEFKNEKLTSFCKLYYTPNLSSPIKNQIESVLLEASDAINISISDNKINNIDHLMNLLKSINTLLGLGLNFNFTF